jgi:co-chaperonin GroES (HSP10)
MSETIAIPDSGLILPPGVAAAMAIPKVDTEYETAEQKATSLPDPKGWRLLCALVEVGDKYESGILKDSKTIKTEELTSPVLFVVKVGPTAYDAEKFPEGPWCAEGDFVITRPYTGTRIMIHGKEFRLINDDQVEATVEDPRGIARV